MIQNSANNQFVIRIGRSLRIMLMYIMLFEFKFIHHVLRFLFFLGDMKAKNSRFF